MPRPWMPLYVADYRLDTPDLDVDQHGVYLLLLMIGWRRGGTIPNDMAWLKTALPRMHGHTFNRLVPPILNRFFELNENGEYTNNRLVKELQNADKLSAKQKQKADKRWSDFRNNKDLPGAVAMPSQSQSQLKKKETSISVASATASLIEFPVVQTKKPEARVYERGKEILGKNAGALITNLFNAKGRNIPETLSVLEMAAGSENPRQYVAGVINRAANASRELLAGDSLWRDNL